MIVTEKFIRKPLYVEAVEVTSDNFVAVATWCQGEIVKEPEPGPKSRGDYIQVRVTNPMTPRQSQAYVGDWILYTPKGYKVYTPKAFQASFDRVEEQQLRMIP